MTQKFKKMSQRKYVHYKIILLDITQDNTNSFKDRSNNHNARILSITIYPNFINFNSRNGGTEDNQQSIRSEN